MEVDSFVPHINYRMQAVRVAYAVYLFDSSQLLFNDSTCTK